MLDPLTAVPCGRRCVQVVGLSVCVPPRDCLRVGIIRVHFNETVFERRERSEVSTRQGWQTKREERSDAEALVQSRRRDFVVSSSTVVLGVGCGSFLLSVR